MVLRTPKWSGNGMCHRIYWTISRHVLNILVFKKLISVYLLNFDKMILEIMEDSWVQYRLKNLFKFYVRILVICIKNRKMFWLYISLSVCGKLVIGFYTTMLQMCRFPSTLCKTEQYLNYLVYILSYALTHWLISWIIKYNVNYM